MFKQFNAQGLLAVLVSVSLVAVQTACGSSEAKPQVPVRPRVFNDLEQDLQKPYLELFQISPKLHYRQEQLDAMHQYLKHAQDYCVGQFKDKAKTYNDELESAVQRLKQTTAKLTDAQRHKMHCTIQNDRALKTDAQLLANHAVPVAYQNREAKLDLIQNWPADYRKAKQELADGSYRNRRWGDVKDIGFRQIAPGQRDDIKTGEDAIKQMKQSGMMPKELNNKAIDDYVNSVAQKVASHSDLHVPLHVTVLNSKEINAFALPGGFLFVERGLLEAADDESELAGVMGHEIGHDVARHGHKLMRKATIESIFYQAAETAAVILTGGVAGIGTYYALQYGFYGLGLLLDLNLLGVSREFELQADQLGMQYAWNAGYDPTGFIRFFDKMATKEGYVEGASWFRDHPPFYERMVDAEREYMFLPKKPNYVVQTTAFKNMKKELAKVTAAAKEESKNRPSLLAPEQGCPVVPKIEHKGEPVEKLCSLPAE